MAEALSDPHAAILSICAAPEEDHGSCLSRLAADEWKTLRDLAVRNRVAPLVVQTIERAKIELDLAPRPIAALRDQARFHALAALQTANDLGYVLSVLAEVGLQPIVLKGIPLAFQSYPDPALRPVRDLDLLLSPDKALSAQALLLAHPDFEAVPGVAQYGLEHSHQLPEIRYIKSGLVIELHHRLNARGWQQEPQLVEAIRTNAQQVSILGQTVSIPSAEDNFLHLLAHATIHHLFANGPLILADLHYLVSSRECNWASIAERADALGLGRSLALVTEMARSHGAKWSPPPDFAAGPIPEAHVETARSAILASSEETERHAILERLAERSGGRTDWTAALTRVLRPDMGQLSLLSGQPSDSPLRWLGYPKWLARKASLFASAKASRSDEQAGQQRLALAHWLKSG